ncbi:MULTISPECIES: putative quinol monooxygenase [unclassified Duganella]|jgi:quinol monooxygenase YgiN|uniref:putative quinol monooxygenase n=1 Tax=unclassified Duganella TaxID=2636909 RepID=UPI00088FD10E|nr:MULTISPECIES: putative quinol monooxygenase [unclassified Duganella]SDH23794.1 Quinol monooxygenase YgiN [Duganella sp. OV458]SDK44624.1 Quinol monooxygenase YgiN [Duganella sp. OV510]
MSAGGITVVARWQPVDGKLGEVLAIVAEMRPKSLAEAGCLGYEAYRGVDQPHSVLLLEHYRDEAALEAHRQSEHYQSLVIGRALPLLADRQVEILQLRA